MEDALTSGGAWESKGDSEKSEYAPEIHRYMESVSHVLGDMSEVKAIESAVQHPTLGYVGIADCVARYR